LQVWITLAGKFSHINCQETFLTKMQAAALERRIASKRLFFAQTRLFLTDGCRQSFLKEKKMSGKETGTKASPSDKRPKGGKNV
jgi:hypothetical protein